MRPIPLIRKIRASPKPAWGSKPNRWLFGWAAWNRGREKPCPDQVVSQKAIETGAASLLSMAVWPHGRTRHSDTVGITYQKKKGLPDSLPFAGASAAGKADDWFGC